MILMTQGGNPYHWKSAGENTIHDMHYAFIVSNKGALHDRIQ